MAKMISRQEFLKIAAREIERNPMLAVTREPRPTLYAFIVGKRFAEGFPRPRAFRKYCGGYRFPDRRGNA